LQIYKLLQNAQLFQKCLLNIKVKMTKKARQIKEKGIRICHFVIFWQFYVFGTMIDYLKAEKSENNK